MYSVGEIVWAKSSIPKEYFWPAEVVESDSDIEDGKQKKPMVAHVHFLAENTYEAIKWVSRIQPYSCKRKEEFLKKGRSSKQAEKRLLFEAAVREAERSIKTNRQWKTTPKKYLPDVKKTSNSPRTRSSNLSDQTMPTTSLPNKSEDKTSAKTKTKCPLPTIFENSNVVLTCSSSTSMKRPETDKHPEKIVTKRKTAKCKHKIDLKEEDLSSKQIENGICNENIAECETGSKEVKNELNCTKQGNACEKNSQEKLVSAVKDCIDRHESKDSPVHETRAKTRSNSSSEPPLTRHSPRIMKRKCVCCGDSNSKEATTKMTSLAKPSVTGALNIKRTGSSRLKGELNDCQRKKFDRSPNKKLNFDKVNDSKAKDKTTQNHRLETISEECQNTRDEMKLKRTRNNIETNETHRKDGEAVRKRNKRPRKALCEEGSESTNKESCMAENEKPLSNKKSVSKKSSRQNRTISGSEGLFARNNDGMKTVNSSANNERTLNDSDNIVEPQGPQTKHNCCDGDLPSGKAGGILSSEEILSAEENDRRLDTLMEERNSTMVESNKSDIEDVEKDDDCSSDDESLPEAFATSPDAKRNFPPGVVVWVKHRKFPFWPAQISRKAHHHKERTHIYVKFLPKSDCKGIKVPKKNVKSFTEDHETYLRYKNQEIDSSLRKEFNVAVEQAEEILLRSVPAFQKDDTLLEDFEEQVSDDSDDDEPQSPIKAEQDKPVCEADKPDEKPDDGESGFDSSEMETENEEVTAGDDESRRKQKPVTQYTNILNELHWCKQRLLNIYREKVPSTRHKTFKYGSVSEKNDLKHKAGFGPVKDEETCMKIISLLKSWYDAERKTTSVIDRYIFDVWLPEAMIYYIQLIDHLSSTEEAERIYRDHSMHVDKRDIKETRELFKNTKIDQETMDETMAKARRRFTREISR